MYDGTGNASALKIGRAGQGATFSGTLSTTDLRVNDLRYPVADGSDGQFISTDGSGTLSFSSILSGTLPDLSPSPANTYTSISAISVDVKGRVTNVITGAGGGASGSGAVYVYNSPINLVTKTGNYNASVSVNKVNKPAGVTHALIRIESEMDYKTFGPSSNTYIQTLISGVRAALAGNRNVNGQNYGSGYANVTTWLAPIDGSNNIDVYINLVDGAYSSSVSGRVTIDLLGYASYNTLSNS